MGSGVVHIFYFFYSMPHQGLPNFGYTCYINSCLQLLFSSKQFILRLEEWFITRKIEAKVIEETGFQLTLPYFLACARLVGVISKYAAPDYINTKREAVECFVDVVSSKDVKFSFISGQQSCAEFLSYYLNLVRNELVLLNRIHAFDSANELRFEVIETIFDAIVMEMDKSNSLEDTPIDEYFSNEVNVYWKCERCHRSQYQHDRRYFMFECSHRYLNRCGSGSSKVDTNRLMKVYFKDDEFNEDNQVRINAMCRFCSHNGLIEELKLRKEAKELIIIYDRVVINAEMTITKNLSHWRLNDSLNINEPRYLKGVVYHSGRTFTSGHYVTVSLEKHHFSKERSVYVYNDEAVQENNSALSLLVDESSSYALLYGNAVIALYSCNVEEDCEISCSEKTKKRKREDASIFNQYTRENDHDQCTFEEEHNAGSSSLSTNRCAYSSKQWNNDCSYKDKGKRLTFSTTHEQYDKFTDYERKYLFKEYHLNPERAVLFHHFNSGSYAFHGLSNDLSKKGVRDKICEEIREQYVSNSRKQTIINKFETEIHGGVNSIPDLTTCACCGVREFERGREKLYSRERGGVRYKEVNLDRLDLLKYSETESNRLRSMIERGSIPIPIDSCLKVTDVLPENVISYFHDEDSNTFYHLHREFVTTKESVLDGRKQRSHHATLCLNCQYSLFPKEFPQIAKNDPEVPKLSIASGCDFGDFTRIGLTKPNRFEITILSKVRKFLTVVKITDNLGERRDYTQSVLKGHAVTFDHDAPVVTSNVLQSFDKLSGSFKLHLMCEDGQRDRLAEKILGSSILLGRPYVIYQWLLVLKRVNVLYQNDNVPDFSVIEKKTVEANEEVVKTMSVTHEENILLTNLKESDDVAEVRSTVHFESNDDEETMTNE